MWLLDLDNIRINYQIKRSINGMASALRLNPDLFKPIISLANRLENLQNDSDIEAEEDEEWDEFEYMEEITPVNKDLKYLKGVLENLPNLDQMISTLSQQEHGILNKILNL
jgi:hypothetical protein